MAIKVNGVKTRVKTKGVVKDRLGNALEPKWDNPSSMDGERFARHQRVALDFYRIDCTSAQYKKWTLHWVNNNERWKPFAKQLARHADGQFNHILGGLCRLLDLGIPDVHPAYIAYWENSPGTMGSPKPYTTYINNELQRILDKSEKDEEEVKQEKSKPGVKVPTIQDRLNELAKKHILYFEVLEDLLYTGESVDPKAYDYLVKYNVPQAIIGKIQTVFEKHHTEIIEARKGECEQLKEAYSHLKASDYKRYDAFYEALFSDLTAYNQTKRATKKAAVRKPPQKEKLVKKLKYLKQDPVLKLVSVNPVDIIGSQILWVYNVKSRKLGKYVADAHTNTLDVKGTTIIGYSESNSTQKTLRKPEQQLKEFLGANKIELRKFLENIKTTEIKLSGRINSDTILLKVI